MQIILSMRKKVIAMAMTFGHVEKTGGCANEGVSCSLLRKLASPCLRIHFPGGRYTIS